GRETRIAVPEGVAVERVTRAPRWLKAEFDKAANEIVVVAKRPGRGAVEIIAIEHEGCCSISQSNIRLDDIPIDEWGTRRRRRVRVAAFGEREAFLITALSCNVHEGWDPGLHDRFPHPDCCGPDKRGHAFPFALNMERILHSANLPITWMIDST